MEKQIAQMEDQAESAVFATPLSKSNKPTASKNGWMHCIQPLARLARRT
jgi:hypothetical protein